MGVSMHEIFHLVHMHHVRRNGREMADWNRACDFAINPAVIKAGATLPAGMLLDPAFAGLGSEEIYRTLQAAKPKPAEDGEDGEKTPQEASEDGEDNGEPQDSSRTARTLASRPRVREKATARAARTARAGPHRPDSIRGNAAA